jgi:hypothetical protein
MEARAMEQYGLVFLLTKVSLFFKAALFDWQSLLVTSVAFIALQIDGLENLPKGLIPLAAIVFIALNAYSKFEEARAKKIANDKAAFELEQLKLNNKTTTNDEEEE